MTLLAAQAYVMLLRTMQKSTQNALVVKQGALALADSVHELQGACAQS